jgi:hypothetical protein
MVSILPPHLVQHNGFMPIRQEAISCHDWFDLFTSGMEKYSLKASSALVFAAEDKNP